MNSIIKQLLNRKSIRRLRKEDEVKEEDLKIIFESSLRSPSYLNAHQISLVYTRDRKKIKKIAELSGGQPQVACANVFVFVVGDFYRTFYAIKSLGLEQNVEKNLLGFKILSVDAGIVLTSLQTAANSLGYGSTAIGAIDRGLEGIIKLFNLPKFTIPLVGATIGVPEEGAKDQPLKPKIEIDSFVFKDSYNKDKVESGVEKYEVELKEFNQVSYKQHTADFYATDKLPQIEEILKKQGFDF